MQEDSAAMASLDAIVEAPKLLTKCSLVIRAAKNIVVRLIRTERPDCGISSQHGL